MNPIISPEFDSALWKGLRQERDLHQLYGKYAPELLACKYIDIMNLI